MAYLFNPEVDKITEKEMVYDIVERLSLGKNLTSNSGEVYVNANTKLEDMLRLLIENTSPVSLKNYNNIHIQEMHISAGSDFSSVTIANLNEFKIIKAISNQTGMDYSNLLSSYRQGTSLIVDFHTKIPFSHDEIIKIFAI